MIRGPHTQIPSCDSCSRCNLTYLVIKIQMTFSYSFYKSVTAELSVHYQVNFFKRLPAQEYDNNMAVHNKMEQLTLLM